MKKVITPGNRRDVRTRAILLAVLILALCLRFHSMGNRPLYLDEGFNTVVLAAGPLSSIVATNRGSLFYPLLLHFLLPLGETEFTARLPAAIFGILSVWLVFLIGRRIFGRTEALLAAFLCATSTHLIYFSQQARGYTGLLLFFLCSLFFFLKALDGGLVRDWLVSAMFSILAIYMNFFAFLIIPIQIFLVGVVLIERRMTQGTKTFIINMRRILTSFLLSLVAIGGIVAALYWPVRNQQITENPFLMLPRSISALVHGQFGVNPLWLAGDILKRQLDFEAGPALFYGKIVFVVLGLIVSWLKRRRGLSVLLTWIFVPFGLFVLSNPPSKFLPVDNKFIFLLPPLALLMAGGATRLYAFVLRALSRLPGFGHHSAGRKAAGVLLIGLLFFGEGVCLRRYSLTQWRLRSLPRSRMVSNSILTRGERDDVLLGESPVPLLNVIEAGPLVFPNGRTKFLFVREKDGDPRSTLTAATGLWVMMGKPRMDARRVDTWRAAYPEMDIMTLGRTALIHFPRGQIPLWQKMLGGIDILLDGPLPDDLKAPFLLYKAQIYLWAEKNQESKFAFDTFRTLSKDMPKSPRAKILVDIISETIFDLLLENATRRWVKGESREAFFLWNWAESLKPGAAEYQGRILFSKAESCAQAKMTNEARNFYRAVLPFCRVQSDEDNLLDKIRTLYTLPLGYVVWRRGDELRLRWWAEKKSLFSGMIGNLERRGKISKLKGTVHYKFRYVQGQWNFHGGGGEGLIQGFNLRLAPDSKPNLLLRIDGRDNISEKIILTVDSLNPRTMPFILD